jgi:hypothetical protein
MPTTVKSPATYADLEAVPPHLVAEIIFGNLVTHPRPAPRYAVAASSLGGELIGPFQKGVGGPGGWIIVDEPELHLGPHVTVPDIAGWRRERMPQVPETAFFALAPDWICEGLSTSTEKHDKGDKRPIYALYGAGYLWQLDPRAKSLETFKREEKSWLLTGTFFDSNDVRAPPFEALKFSFGLLWPFNEPSEPNA